jgi:hypothetical protein
MQGRHGMQQALAGVAADALIAAGRMTQAQVDRMLATMRAHVTERLSQPWSAQGPGFIDQDGDGVCDYAGSGRMNGRGNQ